MLFLLNHKKTTYRQLAKLFEVSTKTVERDIDQLAYAGIPIHCVQGNGGGVFIEEHYKLTKSFFTNEEIENIVFALSAYDSITRKAFKASILKKLCLIAPELTV